MHENDPVQLEGITKWTDPQDEVMGQRGLIQNMTGRLTRPQESATKRKDQIVLDLAEGPSVLENHPAAVSADVTRCDAYTPDTLEAGVTKNLVQRWKSQDLDTSKGAVRRGNPADWIAEMEQAPGSGVFENEPEVR